MRNIYRYLDIFADIRRISMQEAQKINAWYYLKNGVYLQLSEATHMALKLSGGVEKKIRSLLINYLDPRIRRCCFILRGPA
jgi:hypothetical protein